MLIATSALLLGFTTISCKLKEEIVSIIKHNVIFFALSNGNQLLKINAMSSETAIATTSTVGLIASDALTAIDFRPSTGKLYGVSLQSTIFAK